MGHMGPSVKNALKKKKKGGEQFFGGWDVPIGSYGEQCEGSHQRELSQEPAPFLTHLLLVDFQGQTRSVTSMARSTARGRAGTRTWSPRG